MRKLDLSLSELLFVVGTRAVLGAGIGLLLAGKLPHKARRAVGLTLVTLGALTTVPAAIAVLGARHSGTTGSASRAA